MIASLVALVSCLALPAFAVPATSAAAPAASVLTPHGLWDAAHVHAVPPNGKIQIVDDEVHLIDGSGAVVHVAKVDSAAASVKPTPRATAVEPLETGWIAYASWYNEGDPINLFYADWTVPNTPASWDGQTLFYFNSIEPAAFNAILQPVLQYGGSAAGGGEYWALATWWLYGSETYYTTPVETSPGTGLQGIIELVSSSGDSYTYLSGFAGQDGLEISGAPELVWATLTLEVYSVESLSDFPGGSTTFSGVNIGTTSGTPSVSWSTVSDSDDGINTTVNNDGAVNAEVTISY